MQMAFFASLVRQYLAWLKVHTHSPQKPSTKAYVCHFAPQIAVAHTATAVLTFYVVG